MRQGILRNASNASKLSTNSSDLSVVASEPYTPTTPPSRQASQSSYRSDVSDGMMSPPGLFALRREARVKNRVAWDTRPSLPALLPPPPLADPALAYTGAQVPDALPPFVARRSRTENKTILLPNDARFVGEARDSVATGSGTIYYENGDKYEGDVAGGLPHGYGILQHAADDTGFRGRFELGRQKQGVQFLRDGYVFDGCYQGNAAHGPGLMFDDRGFVLRAPFVDGQPHGLGHTRFRSGDSFLGEFCYGRLARAPGVVCYQDGRIALRMMRHGAAYMEMVASQADGLFQQELLAQEQAIAQERWMSLCEIRARMQRMTRLPGAQVNQLPQWSLLSWTPNVAHIKALTAVLTRLGDSQNPTQKAMRHLLRALLHFLGPARPYDTIGEMADTTQYTPARGYPSMQAFVVDTVLPHFGTSRIILGSSAVGEEPVCFAYQMDGEAQFAQRLTQAIDDVCTALAAAHSKDAADIDEMAERSHSVLCSVLDGTLSFDARLLRMRETLAALHMDHVLPQRSASLPNGPSEVAAPQSALGRGDSDVNNRRLPVVVAAHERGHSSHRRATPQRANLAPTHQRNRSRSASLPRRGGPDATGRLSPMIEVSDAPSSSSLTGHS